jgi:IS30 family transposase
MGWGEARHKHKLRNQQKILLAKYHLTLDIPRDITVDNDKYFDNAMFKDFYHQVRMKVTFASLYHAQSNGAVERANALIFEAIKKILEGEKKAIWPKSC